MLFQKGFYTWLPWKTIPSAHIVRCDVVCSKLQANDTVGWGGVAAYEQMSCCFRRGGVVSKFAFIRVSYFVHINDYPASVCADCAGIGTFGIDRQRRNRLEDHRSFERPCPCQQDQRCVEMHASRAKCRHSTSIMLQAAWHSRSHMTVAHRRAWKKTNLPWSTQNFFSTPMASGRLVSILRHGAKVVGKQSGSQISDFICFHTTTCCRSFFEHFAAKQTNAMRVYSESMDIHFSWGRVTTVAVA